MAEGRVQLVNNQSSHAQPWRCITPLQVTNFFRRSIPMAIWVRSYKLNFLYHDFISGITIGLMAIPQCLAYADLAGLSPIYGLYSALFSPFIYFVFGGSKDLSISPVSILSVMVAQYTMNESSTANVIQASSIAFISGLTMILMGIFRLGIIVSFISLPILSGYVSCVGVSVIIYMIKDLCGLKMQRANFPQTVRNLVNHLPDTRPADISLSIGCLVIFLALQRLLKWNNERKIDADTKLTTRFVSKLIWFVGTGRYVLVILIMTLVAEYLTEVKGMPHVFTMIGEMKQGFPKPQFPVRSYIVANTTVSTLELLSDIGPGSVTVTLVAVLNTMAAVKTVAHVNNYVVNMSNEIFALGLITVTGSCFQGFSVAGSLSRSILNSHCGSKTPLNGIFAGTIIVVSLSVLTSWFQYIPKAALAAMIVTALIPMIDVKLPLSLWKNQKLELAVLIVTFALSFYSPAVGLLAGIGFHLLIFIYYNTALKTDIEFRRNAAFVHIHNRNLLYTNAEEVMSRTEEISTCNKEKHIFIDFSEVSRIDTTAAITLKKMELVMKRRPLRNAGIFLTNVSDDVFLFLSYFNFDTTLVMTPEAVNELLHYQEQFLASESKLGVVVTSC